MTIFDAFAQKLVDAIRGLFPARTAHLSERVSSRMMANFHTFRTYNRETWAVVAQFIFYAPDSNARTICESSGV